MRPATTICCSALALIALAAAPSPAQNTQSTHRNLVSAGTASSAPIPLVPTRPLWTLALNNQITVPPAYDDARVFFSIEQDRLVAYDIFSGKQLWLVESRPVQQPAAGADLVFVPESDRLLARRAADGAIAWEYPIAQSSFATAPVFDNGWIVAVTATGVVHALRADDGHAVWTRALGVSPHAPPALAADRVYVSAVDGRVFALNIVDGAPVWERKIGGRPNEILALDERLYTGSTDNFFYCLMTKDGRIDWRWRTGADVIGAPVSDGRRVYFVSLDNVLRAMNAVSGGQQWLRALPLRPTSGPRLAGSTVLVVGQSPSIRAFNAKDGTPSTDIAAGDEVAAPPRVLEDPIRKLPMVLFVTKHISHGAAAALHVRSMEPASSNSVAPLPNPIMPAPMPATR